MITIHNERECCGCSACMAACPAGCIEMIPGTLGAMLPRVYTERCINCGKCKAVCPLQNAVSVKQTAETQQVYAAYAADDEVRFSGSSGGIFGTIANLLLTEGYVVYGAGFDKDLKLRCMRAENTQELKPLLKSKYLQSDISASYSDIRKTLEQGTKVLLVATPCQIAAVRGYLGKNYENLLSIDFLCHGVPSQQLFDRCREYEDAKYGCKTLAYSFRTKIKGGSTPHYFTVQTEKKGKRRTVTRPYFKSVYYAFFQQYISLRESCYDCVFSEKDRVSDLTIADFHAIERYETSINRFDGMSTVILNTEKGKLLFDRIKKSLWYREYSMETLMRDGVLFAEKTKRPAGRDAFARDYHTLDFESFVTRHINRTKYAIYGIYYRLPKPLRRALRNVLHIG